MKNIFFKSRFFKIILFICLFLFGFMLSLLVGNGTMPHKDLIGAVIAPVESFFTGIKNSCSDFFASFGDYQNLLNENNELKSKLASMQTKIDDNYNLDAENERLRALLEINDGTQKFNFVDADVVSRNSDGWGASITINEGTASGLKKKNIVITGEGLIGMITDVGVNWATITTVLDPQIAVGAMVSRTQNVGMTEGSLNLKADGLCKLSYMDADFSVNRGDVVETSGLGGTYPKNIPIGKVTDIVTEDQGLSMYAIIKPAVDIKTVKRVYIITNFENKGVLDED